MVNTTIGLAFSAADTVGNTARELFQLTVLQDARFEFKQVERRRENVVERLVVFQFAWIHQASGVNLFTIGGKLLNALGLNVLELGHADAVLAGDHAAKRNYLGHDLVDSAVRRALTSPCRWRGRGC